MSTTEMVDSGLIPGLVKPKTIKVGIRSFNLLVFAHQVGIRSSIKRASVSFQREWKTGCSLTRGPHGPSAVFWPRQLGE